MPADVSARAAVEALITHYETVGDMVVRFLAQEERHAALRPLLALGRHSQDEVLHLMVGIINKETGEVT